MKELLEKFHFANFLAFIVVLGCFTYFFYISSSAFPVSMVKEISDIKIAFITVLTGIMGYYFGASKKGGTPTDEPPKQ